jgi:predicted RND superfamily exporter protein
MSGTNILYVELDTKKSDGIKNPEFLKKVSTLQETLTGDGEICSSISIAQIIKKMHLEFSGSHAIPDSSNTIAQYLLLLDGSSYERFWDYPNQKANITIFGRINDYRSWTSLLNSINTYVNDNLPDVETTIGGELFLSRHTLDLLRTDQVKSFITALILIFVVSVVLFKSLKKGITVTAPIILAVLINYGILGFCKIPISVSISISSSIILGIGIDYAIHLQSKFDSLKTTLNARDVIPGVFISAGKAILWNVAVVTAGFLTLLFSQMPPNQNLGLVCALGVTASFVSSIIVLPVFLSGR